MKIFVSYRRSVSADVVGRLRDKLVQEFGAANVFVDVWAIAPGTNFRHQITDTLAQVDAVVLVIGPGFETRLADEHDVLRVEIEETLRLGTFLIPVLHGDARMPAPDSVPREVRGLTEINAGRLRPDPDFPVDVGMLVRRLRAGAPRGSWLQRHKLPAVAASCILLVALALGAVVLTRRGPSSAAKVGGTRVTAAAETTTTSGTESSTTADPGTTTPEPSPPTPDPETVRFVQNRLQERGYSITAVDGVLGSETTGALRAFQADAGLDATGAIDQATLTALSDPGPTTTAAEPGSSVSVTGPQPSPSPAVSIRVQQLMVQPFGEKRRGVPICGEPTATDGNDGAELYFEGMTVAGQLVTLPAASRVKVDTKGVASLAVATLRVAPDAGANYPPLTVTGWVLDFDTPTFSTRIGRFATSIPAAQFAATIRTELVAGKKTSFTQDIPATDLFRGGTSNGASTLVEDPCSSVTIRLVISRA